MSQAGSASVDIFPTFQGFRTAVTREVDATATAASTSFGERFRSGVVGAAKGVGVAVAGTITAASAVAAVGVGAIFKKGLERSLNIQDATKQLEGLGFSAENVEKIMGNALNSVRGTAFGLDAAASLAGTVIAAGVKPGQELERTLKLTADAATIARTDLGEMGQIFGKVAASGKLNTDVLNQFAQRGVPLLQFVATEFGVTADEAAEMVSRGEVDFARFQSALEAGVGGAALSSGDTARGAFKNIGAAFGRLGAMFTGGAVEGAPTLFQSIAAAVDRAATALTPFADGFNAKLTPAIAALATWIDGIDFDRIVTGIREVYLGAVDVKDLLLTGFTENESLLPPSVISGLQTANGVFTAIAGAVRDLFSSFTAGDFQGAFGSIGTSLATLQPAFKEFGSQLPDIGSAVATLAAAGLTALTDVLAFLADNVDTIIAFMPLIVAGFVAWRLATVATAGASTALVAAELAALPVQITRNSLRLAAAALEYKTAAAQRVATTATVTQTVAERSSIAARVSSTASMVAQRVAAVAVAVAQRAMAVAQGIATAAQWAFNAALSANPIGIIILAIAALVAGLVFFFTQTELGKEVWANVSQFFVDTWNNIVTVFTAAFQGISDFFTAVWAGIVAFAIFYVSTVRAVIVTVVTAIVTAWNGFWSGLGAFFRGIWEGILAFLRQIAVAILVAVIGFVTGVRTNIENAVQFVQELPGRVLGFLGDLGGLLVDSGKALIQGFIDGIQNMIGGVGDAIGGVMDFVGGFFPRSPAKRGPFSGTGWTKIRTSGAAIADQFASGFSDASPQLNAQLDAAVRMPTVSSQAYAAGSSGTAAEGPRATVIVQPAPGMDEETIGRVAAGEINKNLRKAS